MKNRIIFIVNNEKNILHSLEYIFFGKGDYEIKSFSTREELYKNLVQKPDVVILGNSFAKTETLEVINLYNKKLPIIILSDIKEQINTDIFKNDNYQCINQTGFFVDKVMESLELVLHWNKKTGF